MQSHARPVGLALTVLPILMDFTSEARPESDVSGRSMRCALSWNQGRLPVGLPLCRIEAHTRAASAPSRYLPGDEECLPFAERAIRRSSASARGWCIGQASAQSGAPAGGVRLPQYATG